jgi:hypothetical protein
MKLGAKRAALLKLMQKFVSLGRVRIFSTNTPDPPDWTLNKCFGVFCSVWMHLGSFHYSMKLGAKRAELVQLMQKSVPQSRVRFFRNERTRSTALDPKLMFWCIS